MNVNDLTFGIEIETTMPQRSVTVGSHGNGLQVSWLPEGWRADRDGSIVASGRRQACEFVSPVLKGAEGVQQVIEVVAKIVEKGGEVNSSCGLHVHVGFDRNNKDGLKRLITLVACFEKAIFASTGTKSREQGHWCAGVARYGNAAAVEATATHARYHVLNLTNLESPYSRKQTVEFRAFGASLNAVKILGYIRLCVGLVEKALDTKRVTKWTAKPAAEGNSVCRQGEGQTAIARLFYALGWVKGRTPHTYGNLQNDTHDLKSSKKELMRLAKKYDTRAV